MNVNEEKQKLQQLEEQRQQQLSNLRQNLMMLRGKIIKSIASYNKKIVLKQDELSEVNNQICLIFGHDFTPWEEHEDKYLDRSWYYDRQCMICGKEEKIDNPPIEYIIKDNKGKVHVHKR